MLYVFLFQKRTWSTRMPFSGRFTGQSRQGQLVAERLPAWNDRMIAIHVASDMDAVQSLDGDAVRALQRGEQQPLTITRADFDHAVDVLTPLRLPDRP